ncbi:MAG: LicD family protein [Oscillospiraceae bacterium]|nr:LicD family protein [Oscillospiraceae bacterium]
MTAPVMTAADLTELHELLDGVLRAVCGICDRHGLRYTLYCGTLLGSIRHGGFIPWDDDMDLAMPLRDYRRFLEIAPGELPDVYELQHLGNTDEYFRLWARVCINGTTAMERKYANVDIHHGVFLDIYPFIGAAPTALGLRLQTAELKAVHTLRGLEHWRQDKRKGIIVLRTLLGLIPFRIRRRLADRLLRRAMRDPDRCARVCTLDAAPFEAKFDWADWQDFTLGSFDGEQYAIPVHYDKLLRRMYGDYMTLPPPEQRYTHFGNAEQIVFDLHRDYREYRARILAGETI